jgi:hypothetical protein
MRIIGHWDQVLAQFGNQPGLDEGEVLIELAQPIGGAESLRVPIGELDAAAEAGAVVGLFTRTSDGRRLFIPWSNVTGISDAPSR